MTGYKRVNYYELCRLCTSSQQKDKVHIFREEGKKMQLQHKIQSCFPLLVCEHDYLPKVVCTTCIQSLEQCFNFRQSCINSEAMLSSYFSNFRFTDDFKKAGKVYVKDIGQKIEQKCENILQNVEKKAIAQEPTFSPIVVSNVVREGNQQFFGLELPNIQSKNFPKTSPNNIKTNNNYSSVNSNTNNTINIPKENHNLTKFSGTNGSPTNVVQCSLPSISYNGNITCTSNNNNNNKNSFEPPKTNSIEQDFTNVLKNNIATNQTMMLIDMDQLIDTGLQESEVNKLKEVLLKPPEYKTKFVKDKTQNTEPILSQSLDVKQECTINGVKMYKCEVCDKIFKRREHLYQHSKLHTGVRPFSCIHCPKTFSRKEHLMRHLTSHSGVKDYSCDVCSKRFSRPDNLKKHKKTHQKSPYRCEICSKSFIIKHYYVAHMQAHQNGENILGSLMKVENSDL